MGGSSSISSPKFPSCVAESDSSETMNPCNIVLNSQMSARWCACGNFENMAEKPAVGKYSAKATRRLEQRLQQAQEGKSLFFHAYLK